MPSQRASRLHSISNFCPTVGWRNRSLSSRPTFVPGVFSARRRAHLSAGLIHGEGGVKRSPHKHMCVSEISGWEWADWDENRKQLRGWRRWLLRAGFTESDTGGRRMIDFFFFFPFAAEHSQTHTHTHSLVSPLFLFAVIFNHSFSCLLELIVLPHYLLCPLSCIPFHLSYHFTLQLLQQSCDWGTLNANDPISSLFIDFRALPLPTPGPPHHSALRLPPLLSTSFVSHILFSF